MTKNKDDRSLAVVAGRRSMDSCVSDPLFPSYSKPGDEGGQEGEGGGHVYDEVEARDVGMLHHGGEDGARFGADRGRNLTTLKTQPWIDVAFVYENGRRSVIAFEKGPNGEKVLSEAFAAWGM